jgi:hypothetical protein
VDFVHLVVSAFHFEIVAFSGATSPKYCLPAAETLVDEPAVDGTSVTAVMSAASQMSRSVFIR